MDRGIYISILEAYIGGVAIVIAAEFAFFGIPYQIKIAAQERDRVALVEKRWDLLHEATQNVLSQLINLSDLTHAMAFNKKEGDYSINGMGHFFMTVDYEGAVKGFYGQKFQSDKDARTYLESKIVEVMSRQMLTAEGVLDRNIASIKLLSGDGPEFDMIYDCRMLIHNMITKIAPFDATIPYDTSIEEDRKKIKTYQKDITEAFQKRLESVRLAIDSNAKENVVMKYLKRRTSSRSSGAP